MRVVLSRLPRAVRGLLLFAAVVLGAQLVGALRRRARRSRGGEVARLRSVAPEAAAADGGRGAALVAAGLIVRLRWPIVVGWLAVTALVTLTLPSIQQAQSGALGDLVPRGAAAITVEEDSHERFAFPIISRTIVVERDSKGLSPSRLARLAQLAVALNSGALPGSRTIAGALPFSNALGDAAFARERSTTALLYLQFRPSVGQGAQFRAAQEFVRARLPAVTPTTFVGVTGAIPARAERSDLIRAALPEIELATIVLVALAVALHFRAVGAPLVNLLVVAVAYLFAIRVVAWLGEQLGVSVPAEVQPVIVVLLFGVLTDYCIFFLSRVRRRLGRGADAREAVTEATADLLPIVLTCGLAVVLGSAAMIFARLGFLQAFGPGLALAVLVALLVGLTLVPACLAIGGRAVYWPSRSESGAGPRRVTVARRAVRVAVGHPRATVVVCLILLALAISGATRIAPGNPLIRGLPGDSNARRAYSAASTGLVPGVLSPTVIIVTSPGIGVNRSALAVLQRSLRDQPGVAQVLGPAQNPFPVSFGGVVSKDESAARYVVFFAADPLSSTAIGRLEAIQRAMPRLLRGAGVPRAHAGFAGDTALSAETISETGSDVGRVLPVVLLVIVLVLVVFLRSAIAPLYLVATAALAPLTALGLAVFVFQDALGHGELAFYVPIAASVLLLSLGSDYNVFLAGRIWAEARERPLREAIVEGGAGAAGAISSAALILSATFLLLALVPDLAFREIAFVMAVGLLIDAFLVRMMLIPAVITIVGYRSGWPGHHLQAPLRAMAPETDSRQVTD